MTSVKLILSLVVALGVLVVTVGGWYAWHVRETVSEAVARLRIVSGQAESIQRSSAPDEGSIAPGLSVAITIAGACHITWRGDNCLTASDPRAWTVVRATLEGSD